VPRYRMVLPVIPLNLDADLVPRRQGLPLRWAVLLNKSRILVLPIENSLVPMKREWEPSGMTRVFKYHFCNLGTCRMLVLQILVFSRRQLAQMRNMALLQKIISPSRMKTTHPIMWRYSLN
jgi:hypothetical protein